MVNFRLFSLFFVFSFFAPSIFGMEPLKKKYFVSSTFAPLYLVKNHDELTKKVALSMGDLLPNVDPKDAPWFTMLTHGKKLSVLPEAPLVVSGSQYFLVEAPVKYALGAGDRYWVNSQCIAPLREKNPNFIRVMTRGFAEVPLPIGSILLVNNGDLDKIANLSAATISVFTLGDQKNQFATLPANLLIFDGQYKQLTQCQCLDILFRTLISYPQESGKKIPFYVCGGAFWDLTSIYTGLPLEEYTEKYKKLSFGGINSPQLIMLFFQMSEFMRGKKNLGWIPGNTPSVASYFKPFKGILDSEQGCFIEEGGGLIQGGRYKHLILTTDRGCWVFRSPEKFGEKKAADEQDKKRIDEKNKSGMVYGVSGFFVKDGIITGPGGAYAESFEKFFPTISLAELVKGIPMGKITEVPINGFSTEKVKNLGLFTFDPVVEKTTQEKL